MRVASAALLVCILAVSAAGIFLLPESIPLHFGADGSPDRWGSPRSAGWWGLAATAVVAWLVMEWLARAASRSLRLVNLPEKTRLASLPPARIRPVLDRVAQAVHTASAMMLLTLLVVQGVIWMEANNAAGTTTRITLLVVAVSGTLVPLFVSLHRLQTTVDEVLSREEQMEDRQ